LKTAGWLISTALPLRPVVVLFESIARKRVHCAPGFDTEYAEYPINSVVNNHDNNVNARLIFPPKIVNVVRSLNGCKFINERVVIARTTRD